MQTIVFIGSNKSGTSREALMMANEMGYFTVLFTNRKKLVKQREEFPEVNVMLYIEDLLNRSLVEEQLELLQRKGMKICACISFIDPFVSFAAELSKDLGLAKLSIESLRTMEDKTMVRDLLKNLSVSPHFTVYKQEIPLTPFVEEYKKHLPLIIKPSASNGSKDVLLVQSESELENGLVRLRKKHGNMPILVEEYLDGPQYLIEVLIYKNEITIVGIIEQEISNEFIITGYHYPALITEREIDKLKTSVEMIIRSLELSNGTCHLEMRYVKDHWKLIEINPRMSGGAMNRIIFEGTGVNLVKETIKLFLGKEPDLVKTKQKYVFAKYITVNSRGRLLKVTGKNRASNHDGVKFVYVKPRKGAILSKPTSMGDRYACVIASADTPEEAWSIAVKAAKEIKFYMEPL